MRLAVLVLTGLGGLTACAPYAAGYYGAGYAPGYVGPGYVGPGYPGPYPGPGYVDPGYAVAPAYAPGVGVVVEGGRFGRPEGDRGRYDAERQGGYDRGRYEPGRQGGYDRVRDERQRGQGGPQPQQFARPQPQQPQARPAPQQGRLSPRASAPTAPASEHE